MNSETENAPRSLQGILLMMVNTLSLALLDLAAKALRGEFSAPFIVFFYKLTLLVAILPWILKDGIRYFKTDRLHVHIIRSITGTLGGLCFFKALGVVPMADASALENVQGILIFIIGAIIYKEKVNAMKIFGMLVGFLGAVIVVNPAMLQYWQSGGGAIVRSDSSIEWSGYGYLLAAVFLWAINSVIIKRLGATENNKTQLFYVLLFACLISAPSVLFHFETKEFCFIAIPSSLPTFAGFSEIFGVLNAKHMWMFFGMSVAYFIHSSAYFLSLRSSALSVVIPFRYTKVIFSGGLAYIVFGESIRTESLIGYIAIVIASFIMIQDQFKMRKNRGIV